MSVSLPVLIVLSGPTAAGKTSVAIELAQGFNTEIISADSRQFYKELKIGSAAPDAVQLAEVKHHFVGHLSIHDDYNVSKYESDCLSLCEELFNEKPVIILTGGSGLYIDAVCNGIDKLPDACGELRKSLQQRWDKAGKDELLEELKNLDPEYHSVVDKNNPKRVLRGLEVCLQTGLPYSSFRKETPTPREFEVIKICIDFPREELHTRINDRTELMIQNGLADEARKLYPFRDLNALNTVGYKEMFAYFDGKYSLNDTVEKIKTNTRRYARRQLTWFRKDTIYKWFTPPKTEEIIHYVESVLNNK